MVLLIPKVAFDDKAAEYAILDWLSWKMTRFARSSLKAENQAAVEAAASLEYARTFWNLVHQLEQPCFRRVSGPPDTMLSRTT